MHQGHVPLASAISAAISSILSLAAASSSCCSSTTPWLRSRESTRGCGMGEQAE